MTSDKPRSGDESEGQVSELAMSATPPEEISPEEPAVGETAGGTGDPEGGVLGGE